MKQKKTKIEVFLDDATLKALDAEVERTGLSRSAVIRMATIKHLEPEKKDGGEA